MTEVATPIMERERVRVRGRRRAPWWRRRRRWWLLGGFIALLAFIGIEGFRYGSATLALSSGRDQVEAARQLLATDLAHLDAGRVAAAERHLELAADDFGPRSTVMADGWLAQIGMQLPWLSDQINGTNALRRAGSTGTRVALDIVQLAQHVVGTAGSPSPTSPLQGVVALADQHQRDVRTAAADLSAFQAALAAMPHGSLIGPLDGARRTVLEDGNQLVGGAAPALSILNALPQAIGAGTHRYLVLLENPGEERPSGGYIGAVGVVSFSDGQLSGLQFHDSADYLPPEPHVPTPDPLNRYLFDGQPWELEDANWSPDFPTAMADVEHFYTAGTGETVDGVMSVDPIAIEYLLHVLGTVQVAPYPQVITSSNALQELNYITNTARPGDPGKVFLAPFGQLVTQEMLQAPAAQLPALAAALQRAASEKHVVAYFHQHSLEQLVTGAGFGGAIRPSTSDSLLVDDANLSGTKGDLFVKRSFRLQVHVHPDGSATDQLTLTYDNPAVTGAADQALVPGSGGQYRDYLRVLIPETAQLQSVSASVDGGDPVRLAPDSTAYQFEQQLIGLWLVVPAGSREQITLTYRGPLADISVDPERYQLTWLKQVNALPWPFAVTVHMPSGRTVNWSGSLTTDRSWNASN